MRARNLIGCERIIIHAGSLLRGTPNRTSPAVASPFVKPLGTSLRSDAPVHVQTVTFKTLSALAETAQEEAAVESIKTDALNVEREVDSELTKPDGPLSEKAANHAATDEHNLEDELETTEKARAFVGVRRRAFASVRACVGTARVGRSHGRSQGGGGGGGGGRPGQRFGRHD